MIGRRHTTLFDLTLFPLSLDAGQEQHDLPGLLIAPAPRKTARMRSQDILILMMRLTTPAGVAVALTAAQQQEILNRLAETYFRTPGSVTSGLREVVASLNDFLLSRNLRAGQASQRIGILNLAVVHGDVLILAHGGPSHSFLIDKNGTRHFDDGQSLRGLGLSRQAGLRFHQAELAPNDVLILCADPPPAWARTLGSAQNLSLDHLRRRLLGEAGVQLQSAVIRFTSGKGQLNYWLPEVAARPSVITSLEDQTNSAQKEQDLPVKAGEQPSSMPAQAAEDPGQSGDEANSGSEEPTEGQAEVPGAVPAEVEQDDSPADTDQVHYLGGDDAVDVLLPAEESALPPRSPVHESGAAPDEEVASEPETQATARSARIHLSRAVEPGQPASAGVSLAERHALARASQAAQPPEGSPPDLSLEPAPSERLRRTLAPAWQKGSAAKARISGAIRGLFARLFPKRSEPLINISPSAMLMVAIIVPFIIGTIGTVVYFRLGRAERFEALFTYIQQYAAQASLLAEPDLQRESWKRVLGMVDEAEKYGVTAESEALRHQAQTILDDLEGYVRLDFRPVAGSGFGQDAKITRIVAKLNQVYLLDSSQGRILSMTRTTTGGYEVNSFFNCGPGRAGSALIGPLVDLVELPVNNELNAEILGIDAGGNLVYCASNKTGYDSRPLVNPDAGWGEIVGIAAYNDILFVLDPKANAVYWYSGQLGIYANAPHLYFDEDVPFMADVIDLAIDQEFLYLLHEDGRMTVCTNGGVFFGTTRCTDPAPYGDGREGYDPAPLIFPGAQFTQIQTTQPPDPSLFALDVQNTSIFHLSQRRMNLQRQYVPLLNSDFQVPRRAPTAFAVTPNRRVLVAFDNEVFFSSLP